MMNGNTKLKCMPRIDKDLVWTCARRLSVPVLVRVSYVVGLNPGTRFRCVRFSLILDVTRQRFVAIYRISGSLSVPFLRAKQANENPGNIKVSSYIGNGIGCIETSVSNDQKI